MQTNTHLPAGWVVNKIGYEQLLRYAMHKVQMWSGRESLRDDDLDYACAASQVLADLYEIRRASPDDVALKVRLIGWANPERIEYWYAGDGDMRYDIPTMLHHLGHHDEAIMYENAIEVALESK